MRSYPNAARGLGKMFWSQILSVIAILTMGILIGLVFSVVSLVVYLVGLYQAREDDSGYSTAFLLAIVSLVLNLLAFIPLLGGIGSLVASILDLVVLYLVCRTTSLLAHSINREDLARQGHMVWTINIVCVVIGVIFRVLGVVPGLMLVSGMINLVVSVVSLVGSILYMVFLYRASKALA